MINQKTPVENYQKVIKDAELLYTDTEINKTIDDISKSAISIGFTLYL